MLGRAFLCCVPSTEHIQGRNDLDYYKSYLPRPIPKLTLEVPEMSTDQLPTEPYDACMDTLHHSLGLLYFTRLA